MELVQTVGNVGIFERPQVAFMIIIVRVLYLLRIPYVIPRVRLYGPRYSVWSQLNLLPLNHLDYQLIYAAHHLYPSFLLYTGIRRNRALAKYNSRTSEKIKPYRVGRFYCLLTYRSCERVRNDFDRRLQCLEPPLAIASMRPLARMAENVALDILFDSG